MGMDAGRVNGLRQDVGWIQDRLLHSERELCKPRRRAELGRATILDEPRRLTAVPDIPVRCRRHLQTDLAGRCRDIAVRADVFYRSVGGYADPRHVDVAVRWPHLLGKVARGPVCRSALRRTPLQYTACAVAAIAHERTSCPGLAVQVGPFAPGYGIPYISIAVVYESLALATTVRNDCR